MNHLVEQLETALNEAQPATGWSRLAAPRHLLMSSTSGRLLVMALQEYALLLGCGFSLLLLPYWLWPLPLLLMAGRYHALGVILHDATHLPLRGKPLGHRLVEWLCGYPIGSTLNAMRYHHLRHHRDTGMPSDPYHKPGRRNAWWWLINIGRGLLLVPFWSVRSWFGLGAALFPSLRNAYGRIFLQDRSGSDLTDSKEVRDCAIAEIGQCLWQIAAIAIVCVFPLEALWGYAVPVTLAGLLSAHRVIIEHSHLNVTDRILETQVAHTFDNYLGGLGRLFMAPRNIGYHIVHHIHPQVGLDLLPALREWYKSQYLSHYPIPGRRDLF